MSTFKYKNIFLIIALLTASCVPDSLTKFKEDSIKREQEQEVVGDVVFKDEDDNVISASEMLPPTSLTYTDKIFVASEAGEISPNSGLNDLTAVSSTALATNAYSNYLPRYTIVPALPTGLFLNSKTGYITGTLSAATPSVLYTITLTYRNPSTLVDTTLPATVNIGAEERIPSDFRITFGTTITTKRMGLQLENSASFKLAGVTRVAALSGARGTLLSYDNNGYIYTEITSVSPTPDFTKGDLVDNSLNYISKETTVTDTIFYFETSEITPNIELRPLASSTTALDNALNGVTYEISPDLPANLTLNATTGIISGYVTESQAVTEYTYTIKNNSFTKSVTFKLAIINPPTLLSYSNLKVFQVSNASKFKVGNHIISSPIAPSIEFGKGVVRYVIDAATDYIVVEVTEGDGFKKDQAIDNSPTFIATEAIIMDTPEPLTSIIEVASSAGFSDYKNTGAALPSHIICQTDNASALQHGKAIVTKIVGNRIFAMQSKGIASGAYPGYFRDNAAYGVLNTAGCDALNIGTSSSSVVQKVWSPSVIASVDSSAGFIKGLDIISNSFASGYVSKITGNDMELKVNSQTEFDNGQTLDADKPYDVVDATIASVYTNMKFELERGVETNISAFLLKGDDLIYSITPDLPEGLSLDQQTGAISGTPTKATAEAVYQVTAKNVISSQTIQITIHVQDYFSILDGTGTASSYIMHKTGQANSYSQCRINKEDIDEYTTNLADTRPVDITCFLEGGELDLYKIGAKLVAESGPSVCEFVSYEPFYFMQYKAAKTNNTTFAVIDNVACSSTSIETGAIFRNSSLAVADIADGTDFDFRGAALQLDIENPRDICQALYEDGAINCDTGKVTLTTYSIGDDLNDALGDDIDDGECSYTETGSRVVQCGGNISACIGGPIRDLFSSQEILNGVVRQIIPSNSGLEEEFEISAPSDMGYMTNKYIANEFINYQCTSAGTPTQYIYDAEGLIAYADAYSVSTPGTTMIDPLKGSNPFYTFTCLDSGKDIKARVRLVIRDWDRTFKQENNIDSFLPVGGLIDNNLNDPFGKAYNEYKDWNNGEIPAAPHLGHVPAYSACSAAGTFTNAADALTGTFEGASLSQTVVGTGTYFTYELGVGNTIDLGGTTYTVKEILDDNELLVNEMILTPFAAVAGTKKSITHFPGNDL